MKLKINSLQWVVFDAQVKKVVIDTESGQLSILPGHNPMINIVKPWILKIYPENIESDSELANLKIDDYVPISLAKWMVFVDWKSVLITVSAATLTQDQTAEVLEKMKEDVEQELKKIKVSGSVEDIEKTIIQLWKISADLKLFKLKKSQ